MTDEKLAEEWVGENGFCSDCNNINSVEANREMVNAFLAGLKEQNIKDCENFNKKMKEIKEQWNKEHCQLTKAKEILREYIRINLLPPIERKLDDEVNLFVRAKQFLNSEVLK